MTADVFKKPMLLGSHTVPGIWRYMLPYELTALRIPNERRATCGDCPKVCSDAYRADYRCCTYHPRVANFLLGMGLAEKRSRLAIERVHKDGWLLPEGFLATPQQWAEFLADVGEDRFGRSQNILCPFLDKASGGCNIYAFRNSVCSTFFCLNDHGGAGQQFWDALQTLVMQVEMALGQWALAAAGFDVKAYIKRFNTLANRMESLRGATAWSSPARKTVWGKAYGHELDIYRACAELVSKHRDELWEIANRTDILEAIVYEQASQKLVPRQYRDEIEDDFSKEAETASPRSLWADVLKHYRRLWAVPDVPLQLSDKIEIVKNHRADAEAKNQHSKSHVVAHYQRARTTAKTSDRPTTREFIDASEAEALRLFSKPTPLNARTAAELTALLGNKSSDKPNPYGDDISGFVAEWVGKKVLCKVRDQ